MRPNRSRAAWTAAVVSSGLVMSRAVTSRPSARPTARRTALGSRPVATTAWPAPRATLAMSAPSPRPAPVISHTFLSVMPVPLWLTARPRPRRLAWGRAAPAED
jgi:hypothetical protein